VPRSQGEIPVGREHGQLMIDTELREQSVDGPQLHAGAAASVAKRRGLNMIVPIRHEKGKSRKALDDVLSRPRAGKPLQQLLKDDAGRHNEVFAFQRISKR
jgi:hypothetical protein